MTAREGAAFVQGAGAGMTGVATSILVFDPAPTALITAGIGSIVFGYLIERSARGEPDR